MSIVVIKHIYTHYKIYIYIQIRHSSFNQTWSKKFIVYGKFSTQIQASSVYSTPKLGYEGSRVMEPSYMNNSLKSTQLLSWLIQSTHCRVVQAPHLTINHSWYSLALTYTTKREVIIFFAQQSLMNILSSISLQCRHKESNLLTTFWEDLGRVKIGISNN